MGTNTYLKQIQNSSVTGQDACWSQPIPNTTAKTAQGNVGTSSVFYIFPLFPPDQKVDLIIYLKYHLESFTKDRQYSRMINSKDTADKMTGPQHYNTWFRSHYKEAMPEVSSLQKRFLPRDCGSPTNLTYRPTYRYLVPSTLLKQPHPFRLKRYYFVGKNWKITVPKEWARLLKLK